jgi:hypothetical protein
MSTVPPPAQRAAADLEKGAKELFESGRRHGWWAVACPSVSSYDELDPVGREEFNDIVERIIVAAHQPAAGAEREAILEEAAIIAENGCLVDPDGGSPTEQEYELCQEIASRIRLRKLKGAESVFAATSLSPVRSGMEKALKALYDWYDRDGSVGGASEVFETHRAALKGGSHE